VGVLRVLLAEEDVESEKAKQTGRREKDKKWRRGGLPLLLSRLGRMMTGSGSRSECFMPEYFKGIVIWS